MTAQRGVCLSLAAALLGSAGLCGVLAPPAHAKDPSAVSAADKETARRLLDEGDTLAADGQMAAALEKYRGADALVDVPTTALPVGRACEALGQLVEARDAYLRAARFVAAEPNPAFEDARREAGERAAALGGRIATLELTIRGADGAAVTVTLDGAPVAVGAVRERSVNPGSHEVRVAAPGYREARAAVELAEGETKRLTLDLEVDPLAPAGTATAAGPSVPAYPVSTVAGFALSGAALAVGIGTGVGSLAKGRQLADACGADELCPVGQGLEDVQQDGLALANASNVAFAVAGAGALFGLVALFAIDDVLGSAAPAEARLAPYVGPGALGVRGSF
ncbi:MAG: PEGA domain-containing protein [Myxococcales bacterium]|nr:PEGA domain-containing protein [Myxococcales bacterium]